MIDKKIVNAVYKAASETNKNDVINEIIKHISLNYDYNNSKQQHVLEMLVDGYSIVTPGDVDIDYIKNNPERLIYHAEQYDIDNIAIADIDNIECIIRFTFDYISKDDDTKTIHHNSTNVSFIDYPKVLKNS